MSAQPSFDLPDAPPVGPVVLHDVRDVTGWVRVAGDAVTGLRACLDDESVPVRAGDVQAIQRLVRRLDAARLAALSRIDAARNPNRTPDRPSPSGSDDTGTDDPVGDDGSASTGAWYGKATRTDGPVAASDAQLARRLGGEDLESTREAMDDGSLSTEHAKVIARAMADLSARLTAQERQLVERHLVEQARILEPARLRRLARRALAALERPDAEVDAEHGRTLQTEEERARARTRLTLHDNGDGTTSGHFTVPTLTASVLRKVVQQMTAPRRQSNGKGSGAGFWRDPNPNGNAGTAGPASPADTASAAGDAGEAPTCRPASDYADPDGFVDGKAMATDWAHAQGLAFMTLLEHLPTDHLNGKVAATVVINLDYEKLVWGLGAAGVDTGIEISAADARRMACNAGLVPAVLGGGSLPLDLGRQTRLFSEHQRLALATIYDMCAIDGCDRPFAWTEIHHLEPFVAGGSTDLTNAAPACAFHHHKLDDPSYEHSVATDAKGRHTIFLRRRT